MHLIGRGEMQIEHAIVGKFLNWILSFSINCLRFCCRHNTRNSMETMRNIRRKVTNILIYYATNQVFMTCPEGCKLTPQTGRKATGVPAQAHPFIRAEYLAHLCSHLRHTHTHTCNHISHTHTFTYCGAIGGISGEAAQMAVRHVRQRLWHCSVPRALAHQSRRLVILADRWSVCVSEKVIERGESAIVLCLE